MGLKLVVPLTSKKTIFDKLKVGGKKMAKRKTTKRKVRVKKRRVVKKIKRKVKVKKRRIVRRKTVTRKTAKKKKLPKVLIARKRQTQRNKGNRKIDSKRPAMEPGKRISKTGRIYYEYRRNRSDYPGRKV